MFRLLSLETRRLFRERLGLAVLVVMMLACVIAVVQGRTVIVEQQQGRDAFADGQAEAARTLLRSIASATPATISILPRRTSLPIVAPLPTLADFSAGRMGFEAYSTVARLGLREDALFKQTRLDNPEMLARGQLDLGFVVAVILPLLLIALGYGVFAADRDSGVAPTVIAQSPSVLPLLLARSLPRLALVVIPIVLAAGFLLLTGPSIEGRDGAAATWLLLTVLLALFWWSVILLVNSFRITAESAALVLVSIWVVATLVLPPLIAAVAQSASPAPSRFEQIAVSRATEVRVAADFENDHPELIDSVAERRRQAEKAIQIDRDVDAALAPINAGFEEQRAHQRAVNSSLSFLSPTLVTADAQAVIAGTDGATWLDFRRTAGAYLGNAKRALSAILAAEQPLTVAAYQGLPRFAWSPPRQQPVAAVLYLIALTVVVGGLAFRRFRRIQLV
jgi:ABC-type transport system involved in multi-copper enzyme maturation permease subunit